jgi:hypothetical protein
MYLLDGRRSMSSPAPRFQPKNAPTFVQPQETKQRKKSRSRRYIPPSFTWIKSVAWLNLAVGGILVFSTIFGPNKLSEMDHKLWLLLGLFYLMFVVTPIAVLMRTKAGFYLGLVATIPVFFAFPLGTIFAVITYKAFMDAREAFGVR